MDEPKVGQDPSQAGDPSVEPTVTSTEPKTHTAETEKKAVDDALSAAGRDAKTITEKAAEVQRILTAAQQTQTEVEAERKRWQDERDETAREEVRQDPEALKSLNERIRQRDEAAKNARDRAELDADKTKHQERLGKADKIEAQEKALEIATPIAAKHNVDVDSLIKFTDGSKEAMEELATQLPKKGETRKPLKTDSSTTLGVTGDLSGLSPTERKKAREAVAYKK